jgi:hypothetical protein
MKNHNVRANQLSRSMVLSYVIDTLIQSAFVLPLYLNHNAQNITTIFQSFLNFGFRGLVLNL